MDIPIILRLSTITVAIVHTPSLPIWLVTVILVGENKVRPASTSVVTASRRLIAAATNMRAPVMEILVTTLTLSPSMRLPEGVWLRPTFCVITKAKARQLLAITNAGIDPQLTVSAIMGIPAMRT